MQYFLKTLSGEKPLPTAEDMLTDTKNYIENKKADGFTLKNYHALGKGRIKPYCDTIASLAGIPSMKPVITKIFHDNLQARWESLINYRNINYHIVDDETYYTTQ